ncbi:MAG: hypothetical protein WD883_00515 [Candidatus Colwellbacteria bacterium]
MLEEFVAFGIIGILIWAVTSWKDLLKSGALWILLTVPAAWIGVNYLGRVAIEQEIAWLEEAIVNYIGLFALLYTMVAIAWALLRFRDRVRLVSKKVESKADDTSPKQRKS